MDLSDYQKQAARTIPTEEVNTLLTNFCLGLAGEAGELIDHVKKVVFHGHSLDEKYLSKELGDLLWYIAGLSSILKLDLSVIGDINIDKLKRRYPDGFNKHHSQNRGEELDASDMMTRRKEAAYEVIGAVNTSVREGDKLVGGFVDIDQAFLECSDGTGYRLSFGPMTGPELRALKKRLGMED